MDRIEGRKKCFLQEPAPAADADAGPAQPAVKVDAKLVKQLRDATGAGMMDCKKALAESSNDTDAAKVRHTRLC